MSHFQGRRVVILGLARQGLALARYLALAGAEVVVSDLRPAEQLAGSLAALRDLTIETVLGGHPESLLDGADLLCLSGGVAADLPLAQTARRRGVPLSNDSQIFLEVCASGVRTLGITGSAGKTTTTTLVGRMLTGAASGRAEASRREAAPGLTGAASGRAWVGGNIGNPLLSDVERMAPGDFAVMELSSFQLEIMTRSPQVAAVLNVTPNHLDRHGTMEAYTAAKSHILLHQAPDDAAVLGLDDPGARGLAPLARGRCVFFSAEAEVEAGAWLRGEDIFFRGAGDEQRVCGRQDIQLRGSHNVLNVLAACAIAGTALERGGVPAEAAAQAMRAGLEGFTGVEHRLELVRERGGVRWYNDSMASAPERVIAALHSFDEPVVLLAGGRDKKLPWDAFARLARQRVKALVLFGEAGPMILREAQAAGMEAGRCVLCPGLAQAVAAAADRAESGDVVLLSPGCTSFDEFKDFAERGEKFKAWVRDLR